MHFNTLPKDIEKKIKKETIFFYNGIQCVFHLEEIKLLHGKILVRFHINTYHDMINEIFSETFFFDGRLIQSDIELKCYCANIEKQLIKNGNITLDDIIYKINIIGEVIDINQSDKDMECDKK